MFRLIFVSIILLYGCSTPYQHASKSLLGGYTDEYLGDDIYRITVRLNAFTDKATAYEYFHRRARELTQQKGYDRYEVMEIIDPDEYALIYWGKNPQLMRKPRIQGRIKCYQKQTA